MPTAYQGRAWLRVLGHAVTGPLGSPLPRLPLRVPADWPGGVGHEGDASLGERGVPELCRVAPPEASENRAAACWQPSRARSTIFMRLACPCVQCSAKRTGWRCSWRGSYRYPNSCGGTPPTRSGGWARFGVRCWTECSFSDAGSCGRCWLRMPALTTATVRTRLGAGAAGRAERFSGRAGRETELLIRPVGLLCRVQYVTHNSGVLGLDPAVGGADVQRRHGFDA
jgi:hypothetical protein